MVFATRPCQWWCFWSLLVWPLICFSQEDQTPSLEFLEYLGEWQDDSGEPFDPLLLSDQEDNKDSKLAEGNSE
ncbi:MAG: hypothetical protein KTR35_10570 [Gammaproteobacteria bacterium]|nr:hypothetical protein [Gammaproteobacteria bacterium]